MIKSLFQLLQYNIKAIYISGRSLASVGLGKNNFTKKLWTKLVQCTGVNYNNEKGYDSLSFDVQGKTPSSKCILICHT